MSVTPAVALPSGFELGNATTTVTITDDDASPVLADMAPVSVGRFETVDITASATDADGDSLSYTWSRADATQSASNYYCYLYVPDGEGWSFTDLSSSRLTFASAQAGFCNMRVTVDDGHGNTDSKTVVITVGTPVVSAPAKPTGFKASPGSQQVSLTWDNPGNANISKWQVQQKAGSGSWGSWEDISGSGATTTSHTVTGLSNGTAYGFKIRAVAGTVEGTASDEVSATPKGVTRHILFAPQMSVKSGVTLLGIPSNNLENPWYILFSIRSTDYFKATDSSAVNDYFRSTGERVSLQIQYQKTGSPASEWIDVDRWSPYPMCGGKYPDLAPINQLYYGKCEDTAIDTPWPGMVVYRRTRSLPVDRHSIYYGTIVYEAISHEVAIRIRGVNSFGPGFPSQWITVNAPVISAPAKPTGFKASPGSQQVSLTWDNPGNANISKWQVQQKTGSNNYGGWVDISGSGAATVSHTVTGLSNGTAYRFKIRAVAGTVEGDASDEVSATPELATVSVPATLQVTEGTDTNAVVRITASKAFGEAVTFNVSYGGAATADVDYDDAVGSITFNATDTSKDITIPLTNDNLDEDNETLAVTITPAATLPSGFELGNARTSVTITDDDASPVLRALADVTVTAGQAVDITASATDEDGDTVSYAWSRKAGETTPALPQGTALNQARLRFTPTTAGVYTMTVTADDGYGNTATEEVTIKVSAPVVSVPAPTGLRSYGGNQQVLLRWTNPGNDKITKYQVQQNSRTWVDASIDRTTSAVLEHVVTGLTNGTSYRFKIRAVAGTVEGAASKEVRATPKGVTAPTLTATTRANSDGATYSVDLTWTVADTDPHAIVENAERITRWAVYYRLKGAMEWTGLDIPNSNGATRNYTHTGKKGTEMEYRVRATGTLQNTVVSGEESYSNTVTVTLADETPAQPTGFTAQAGDGEVILSWDDPGNADITKWQYEQNSNGTWEDIPGSGAATTSHTVTGLTNGTAYRFKIRAVNGAGAGEASEEVAATPTGDELIISVANARVVEGDLALASWSQEDLSAAGQAVEFTITLSGSPSDDVNLWAATLPPPPECGTALWNSNSNSCHTDRGRHARPAITSESTWAHPTIRPRTRGQVNDFRSDFMPLRKSIVFDANASGDDLTKKVKVVVIGDLFVEGDETFVLRLDKLTTDDSRVAFAGGGDNIQVTGTIVDNDNRVSSAMVDKVITGITAGGYIPANRISNLSAGNWSALTEAALLDTLERVSPSKTFWAMDFDIATNDKLTGLQIQYERADRPEEGPSKWIDIVGWCPGSECDGAVTGTPWLGRVVRNEPLTYNGRHNEFVYYNGRILYEAVPYKMSIRIRGVNSVGQPGSPSQWTKFFKGDQSQSIIYPDYYHIRTLQDSVSVSVSDAKVAEAPGAELAFKVTLDWSQIKQRPGPIDVTYFTRDRTATAGADYIATSGRVSFSPGETEKTVTVAVLDDAHDEASETMELLVVHLDRYRIYPWDPRTSLDYYLRNYSEAPLATGTGTIVNTDSIPAAWLGRFGRTVADHALDAISKRIAAERTPGLSGSLAGQSLPHMPFGSGSQEEAEVVSDVSGSETGDALSEAIYHAATASDSMSGQDLLLGTNFSLSRGADATGGNLTFWGRAAYSGFDGKEGDLSLDGEVVTGLLGMDYARQRWLLGLAVSRSGGTGSYNGSDSGDGKIEASLTAGVPYGAWQATDWLKLWGALGYGRGEMTLKPDGVAQLKADLNWTMAAVGARAALLDPDGEGLSLDLLSDALWTRTTSEKVVGLAGTEAEVTRLRLGLEGSWANLLQGGGELTPKFSLGARYDGGDAETGFGMELGGGVVWSSPGLGLSLDLDGRTLLFHEADGLRDWGFSAGLVFDPQPDSKRGLSVTLGQDWGGEATGGIDALFAANPLEQRSGVEGTSRWTLEAAYGLPAFAGRFTGAPYVGLALAAGARDYTVGWRLTPESTERDITFEVKATRSESSDARPDHGVELDIRRTW